MKTSRFVSKSQPAQFIALLLGAVALLFNPVRSSAAVIVSVVETGGDNEATDTITAKWTGVTYNTTIANEPIAGVPAGTPYTVGSFGPYAPQFVDRAHAYTNASGTILIPSYLMGAEYIMSGNDNRDNAGYLLDVTVSTRVTVYMLIDNRLGGNNADPPTFGPAAMQWILDEGWLPTTNGINRTSNPLVPDEVGTDEAGGTPAAPDGTINQWFSVYFKQFPAGTFQLKQADNAGQNMYGVVIVSTPDIPQVTLVSPTNNNATFYAASSNLIFAITSATPMDTSNIQLVLNGASVTNGLVVSGDDINATVAYSGLASNTVYTGTLTVTNINGPTVFNFQFDTFVVAGNLVIEAEDYNFSDGDCADPSNPGPAGQGGYYYDNPAPGTYNVLPSYPEIDYHDTSTNSNSSVTNAYRLCDAVGTRISGDVVHPPFDLGAFPDYELWQMQSGEWLNYTRTIAAGTYAVYLRVASTAPASIRLDKVSGDVTLTTNQTTVPAGTFTIPNTGGAYAWVRLTDVLGSNAVVTFAAGGPQTVRLSAAAANNNVRPTYFIFVPTTTAALPPTIASVSPPVNATDVPLNAVVQASIVNGSTAANVPSIVLKFDGVDVSNAMAVTNTTAGVDIYYDPPGLLVTNTTYSVYLQFSDNGAPARSFTNTWTFTTISGAPFITQIQQGTANHWGEAIWSRPPNPALTTPVAGNKYVAIAGGGPTRVRNPATGSGDPVLGVKTFPGDSLQLNAGTEIRAKGPGNTLDFPGVGGEAGLIFNGGNIDAGDDAVFPITGVILVQAPSSITSGDGTQDPRGWQIAAEIRGNASLQITKQVTSTVPAVEVTSLNNPFSGDWIVLSGLLKGTGSNSLGTGDITIAATNSALAMAQVEIMYDIDSPGVLTLTNGGQLILHQEARFGGLIIEGTAIPNGLHSYADLAAAYPNNFAAGGSGSIFVSGPVSPSITLTNLGLSGTNFTFQFNTSSGTGYTVEYKNDIGGPNWTTLQTVTGTGGLVTVTNSIADATNRFFRVRSP